LVQRQLHKQTSDGLIRAQRMQIGILIACGLVAGSALMDVVLALIFSVRTGPDSLRLVGEPWENTGVFLGVFSMIALALWMKHRVCSNA